MASITQGLLVLCLHYGLLLTFVVFDVVGGKLSYAVECTKVCCADSGADKSIQKKRSIPLESPLCLKNRHIHITVLTVVHDKKGCPRILGA
ncbi:hypothetical protein OAN307_c32010 [Octadecabacter antarcticus 307]|uniref:Uncharacterized protein n=1 Tax=Octadecabacter antarcticus 307 TaxID=391626 RepID=M9R7S5_9RHOB|nr:hypothetical protein OAN307_c32010 [Octadecabacter antarcticus 307]